MLYVEIREDYQTGTYSARVFDGPDGIDDALLTANSLGELFEKITIFRAFNGITYSDDPRDCIRDYFDNLNPAVIRTMKIRAKVAIVEVNLSVEDFLEEWEELEEEGEPTQQDYDNHLEAEMRRYLQREGDCAKVTLRIKGQ